MQKGSQERFSYLDDLLKAVEIALGHPEAAEKYQAMHEAMEEELSKKA